MRYESIKALIHNSPILPWKDVAVLVATYRRLESRASSLTEVAKDLDVKREDISKIHIRLAKELGVVLWDTDHGGIEAIRTPEVAEIVLHLERSLENMAYIQSRKTAAVKKRSRMPKPLIRIGAGAELTRWFVPEAIRRYRAKHRDAEFEVFIEHDQPQNLRRRGLVDGEFDIVVTSVGQSDFDIYAKEIENRDVELQMCIMVDRSHRLATDSSLTWNSLANMTIIQLSGRDPVAALPVKQVPETARYVHTPDYSSAFAMTLAGAGKGDVCWVGFPEILTPQRKARFFAFSLPEMKRMRFAVFLPEKTRRRVTKAHGEMSANLANGIGNELRSLTSRFDGAALLERNTFRTWHVGLDRDRNPYWVGGRLKQISVANDGYMRADHMIAPNDTSELRFAVSGRISTADKESYHFIFRGWEDDAPALTEAYAASFQLSKQVGTGPFIGYWVGRSTLLADQFVPDIGYMILHAESGQDPSGQILSTWIKEHEQQLKRRCNIPLGRLQLEVPDFAQKALKNSNKTPSRGSSR